MDDCVYGSKTAVKVLGEIGRSKMAFTVLVVPFALGIGQAQVVPDFFWNVMERKPVWQGW